MFAPLVAFIARSLEISRSRRQLARLDARALADLGLTMADVHNECSRPFWDWGMYRRDEHRQIDWDAHRALSRW